jgi:23S rRNA pseudouridine1911/1915/1917 synthase
MALEGRLRVDGRRAGPSTRVRLGQTLTLCWSPMEAPPAVSILRVTERFVYADKPAGIHTHRQRPSDAATLADAVAIAHPECRTASAHPREHGAVHRLDRTTSGVVAFARHAAAWEAARRGLSDGRVDKLYLAICRSVGRLPPGRPSTNGGDEGDEAFPVTALPAQLRSMRAPRCLRVDAPLGHAEHRGRVKVRDDGLEALTIVWPGSVPERSGEVVVCLLRLRTGRRHQARVHLAHIGLPIVGDAVYGQPEGAERPLLHALRLDLSRVCPGERPVDAPLPADVAAAVP